MDLDRISVGNEGFFCICRAVCEEREETAGSVSCIFLLLDSRMADSSILMETQVHVECNNIRSATRHYCIITLSAHHKKCVEIK